MLLDGDLITTKNELMQALDKSIDDRLETGVRRAKLDAEYQILRRKEMLRLKSEGVSVTLIDKFVAGIEEVALAKQEKDIAEVIEDTVKERINALKLELRTVDNQSNLEWTTRSSDY